MDLFNLLPIGSSPGQMLRAADSLTTATFSISPSFRNKRPARSGILIAPKYSAVTFGQAVSGISFSGFALPSTSVGYITSAIIGGQVLAATWITPGIEA